jgi:hypothetical protein
MNFEEHKIDRENLFSIGADTETGRFVISVVVPWITWYNRYFGITREEYDSFDTNREILKNLASSMSHGESIQNLRDRFIFSEYPSENDL